MDVLVARQRAELFDPGFDVVQRHPFPLGDPVEVDVVDHLLVVVDHAVGYLDTQIALCAQDREPQSAFEEDLLPR